MNAIQILIKDHEELKDLFKQFEEAGDRATKKKQTIAQKAMEELVAHSQLEEQIYYPAVQKKAPKEIQDLVLEGIEEHRVADFLMEKIRNTPAEEDLFTARFKVLMESVRHHLKEEEKELFPESRKILGEELDPLGAQMEDLEKKLES